MYLYELVTLKNEIKIKKHEMVQAFNKYGLYSGNILEISLKLDDLINKYQKLLKEIKTNKAILLPDHLTQAEVHSRAGSDFSELEPNLIVKEAYHV